jgi:hypothetical protein
LNHILKVVQIPSQKYGFTYYWYDKYYGLHQYTSDELTEMSKDGVKIVIVDSLEELGVYEN